MNRHTAHATTKTPARTGGEDRPAPACQGRPEPYDVLVEHTAGPAFHAALRVARDICGGCPLMVSCLNANRDEQWARAVLGIAAPASTGTAGGNVSAERNRERGRQLEEERVAMLRDVIARGGDVDTALRDTGMKHDALYTWCRRRGHLDLWNTLHRGMPRKRALVASCGTESGYLRHRRQGERPCSACYAARNESQRIQRERRKAVAA